MQGLCAFRLPPLEQWIWGLGGVGGAICFAFSLHLAWLLTGGSTCFWGLSRKGSSPLGEAALVPTRRDSVTVCLVVTCASGSSTVESGQKRRSPAPNLCEFGTPRTVPMTPSAPAALTLPPFLPLAQFWLHVASRPALRNLNLIFCHLPPLHEFLDHRYGTVFRHR